MRLRSSYKKLLTLTGRVRRQAGQMLGNLRAHRLRIQASQFITVLQAEAQLRHYLPLVDQAMAQTQARIFQGQTHHEGKVLSLYERQRKHLLQQIEQLIPQVLLRSLSETYRRCGNRNCRCHACLRELGIANKERLIPSNSRARPKKKAS